MSERTVPQGEYRNRTSRQSFIPSSPIVFDMEGGSNLSARRALNHEYQGLLQRDDRNLFDRTAIYIRIEVRAQQSEARTFLTFFEVAWV